MSRYIILMNPGDTDSNDLLSVKGTSQVKCATRRLYHAGFRPDTVLTTFEPRTVDSGTILVEEFRENGLSTVAKESDNLDRGNVLHAVGALSDENAVVLIAGNVSLYDGAEKLTGTPFDPRDAEIRVIFCDELSKDRKQTWPEIALNNRHRVIWTYRCDCH